MQGEGQWCKNKHILRRCLSNGTRQPFHRHREELSRTSESVARLYGHNFRRPAKEGAERGKVKPPPQGKIRPCGEAQPRPTQSPPRRGGRLGGPGHSATGVCVRGTVARGRRRTGGRGKGEGGSRWGRGPVDARARCCPPLLTPFTFRSPWAPYLFPFGKPSNFSSKASSSPLGPSRAAAAIFGAGPPGQAKAAAAAT